MEIKKNDVTHINFSFDFLKLKTNCILFVIFIVCTGRLSTVK